MWLCNSTENLTVKQQSCNPTDSVLGTDCMAEGL